MKHEWRKHEKTLYLPKNEPIKISVPPMKYFAIDGSGNPNSPEFGDEIQALYAMTYGVRMSHKSANPPQGYFDYTVYPLEGVWDISDEAKKHDDGKLDKDELVYTIMIRQPAFVTEDYFQELKDAMMKKKNLAILNRVRFFESKEEECVHMLHLGPYDDEPASFERMEAFIADQGLVRESKMHREIYLTDARKTKPENMKTVLRVKVRHE